MINKALLLALKAHKNQIRKVSKVPYIVHILDVMKYLLYETNDEELIVAGILHDTLEDTSVSKEEIRIQFNERVLSLVQFCSEKGITKYTSKRELIDNWKHRKQETIDKSKCASDDELLVELADKLANLTSLREDYLIQDENIWDYFHSSKKNIRWYYVELGKIFEERFKNSKLIVLYKKEMKEVFGKI